MPPPSARPALAAAAAAFALGASYVLTGTINEACVESGLSDEGKQMLAAADIADIADDRERVNDYCGLCFGVLQYETGQWATAWLANRTSVDEVFHGFFPRASEQGIDRAFELSFGLSIDEFMVQFEDFLRLPRAQQMAILPIP